MPSHNAGREIAFGALAGGVLGGLANEFIPVLPTEVAVGLSVLVGILLGALYHQTHSKGM